MNPFESLTNRQAEESMISAFKSEIDELITLLSAVSSRQPLALANF